MRNAHAVILEEHSRPGADTLVPAFERGLGMHRLDAVRAVDRAGLFVAEKLEAGRAEALREELAGAGVRAHVVPPDKLVAPPNPDCVRTVRIADDALHVTLGYTGPVVHLEWDRIVLLCAGEITDSDYVPPKNLVADAMGRGKLRAARMLETSARFRDMDRVALRSMERKRDEERSARREYDVQLADVIARHEDKLIHVRLRSRDLYYELILGPDFSRDFRRDFPEVLARVAERADRAFVAPGYLAACLGPDAAGVAESEWRFGDQETFDDYVRWRLQTIALGLENSAETVGAENGFRPAPAVTDVAGPLLIGAAAIGLAPAAAMPAVGANAPPVVDRAARPPAAPDAPAARRRELLAFAKRVDSGLALVGKALRGLVALAFLALLAWAWLKPEGLVPYVLLGLALGDMTGMVFVIVNPIFTETLRDYHPESFALDVASFIFLSGHYWSGESFGEGPVDLGTCVFIVMGTAGAGFVARMLSALARETASDA